ncbi:glycine cleavage system aminomethyltransferase GcvT [Halocalculus aciditolerans]|uniref:Probable aminomethyltransferase n=1 Tax=Halocalculus aciditolerans TaxID=1383812 RepID=A0A830F988_9EURY|nr:glycine cleavage system aminomethyltransferase GcvT [Halocalculus aciditolerans]GGL52390.1 glycine cleavage system protein T [Halocalculus aciditolerans]
MGARTPPLRGTHEADGATFTDFGGWEMPVQFEGIRAEHAAVREEAGKFDVSHMGEIRVRGPDADELTSRLTSNDVSALDHGDAQYAAITNDAGAMLDDTVVYRLPESDDDDLLFVPNAGHDDQMYRRWTDHRDEWDLAAEVENVTAEYAMFAVQGPDAPGLVDDLADADLSTLSRFSAQYADVAGVECWVARTGYTGEDGFELVLPAEHAETVWDALDCRPCGLGARDTLRQEYGFLLSGQDFDPETNPRTPVEADIGFAVDVDHDFPGRDVVADQLEHGTDEVFTGLVLTERGVPRHGYEVRADGERIGELTSGTMSPTLDQPIGLGYIDTGYAEDGQGVTVVIRGEEKTAEITTPPFL